MKQISSYLTFNGNCREAMKHYQQCLGGELDLQTIGESPVAEKMPSKMKDCILHATLTKDGVVIMGTDMVEDHGLMQGNTVSLMLDCSTEEEIRSCYASLSDGGEQTHPLAVSFWGALSGDLIDKYGNRWLLNYTPLS